MVTKIALYKAFDGKTFETAEEAHAHEKKCLFIKTLANFFAKNPDNNSLWTRGEDVSPSAWVITDTDLPHFLAANATELKEIFDEVEES